MIVARAAVVAIAVLGASPALAQTTADRAYVGFTVARATAIGSRGSRLDDRQQLELRAPLPPIRTGRTFLLPSLGYETRWLGLERAGALADTAEPDRDRTFHRFQLGVTMFRPLTSRWLAIAGVTAAARTDFQTDLDLGMDTSWTAFAMASYGIERLPGARVTLGLVALYPIDTVPVIPMVGFSYRSGRYAVELTPPRLGLFATVRDGLELGVTGGFDRQAFRTELPLAVRPPDARYVRQTSLCVGPAVNASLGAADLWMSASIGLDVLNDFTVLDEDRDPVALVMEPSTRPAPYARVMLSWRPPRPSRPSPSPPPPPSPSPPPPPGR